MDKSTFRLTGRLPHLVMWEGNRGGMQLPSYAVLEVKLQDDESGGQSWLPQYGRFKLKAERTKESAIIRVMDFYASLLETDVDKLNRTIGTLQPKPQSCSRDDDFLGEGVTIRFENLVISEGSQLIWWHKGESGDMTADLPSKTQLRVRANEGGWYGQVAGKKTRTLDAPKEAMIEVMSTYRDMAIIDIEHIRQVVPRGYYEKVNEALDI